MASVKGRNTSPERLVKRILRHLKCRYRSNAGNILGTPDFELVGRKKLIFVHGCFWHGHKGCPRATRPETNKQFWSQKIEGNIKRDGRNLCKLRKSGWSVAIIWQCQTRNEDRLKRRIERFIMR
jgi:DNA mismatch endonuclease (patch repair protein)